jgi:probable rRNA maturation factor
LKLLLNLDVDERFANAVDSTLIQTAVERALKLERVRRNTEITVVITDDEDIRGINAEHRGIDEATDVLSFPLESSEQQSFVAPPGQPRNLGDIVVSYERVLAQAAEYGHSVSRELAYLVTHGALHLLGYDHEDEAQRTRMREREEQVLADIPREPPTGQ